MSRRDTYYDFVPGEELAQTPAPGLAILLDDQRFDLVHTEDYTRADGGKTVLLVWHSECPTCGCAFTTKTGSHRFPAIRRCADHRRPGKRVGMNNATGSSPERNTPKHPPARFRASDGVI